MTAYDKVLLAVSVSVVVHVCTSMEEGVWRLSICA